MLALLFACQRSHLRHPYLPITSRVDRQPKRSALVKYHFACPETWLRYDPGNFPVG